MSKVKLAYVTTVPTTLGFFRGHIVYLESRGFEVDAIASHGEELESFAQEEQIKTHAVCMERRISPWQDLIALWRLYRLLRVMRPHIVHANTPKGGLLGMLAAWLAGVPVRIYTIHGLPLTTARGWKRRLLRGTERVACRCASVVLAVSHSIRAVAIQEGICVAERIKVLLSGSVSGVDAEGDFSPQRYGEEIRKAIRQRYNIPDAARVIGFVGRIVADKGMHELAAAWRLLREEYADLHLVLVGPFESVDPLRPEDKQLFQTDPRVHLAGQQNDIPPLLAAMDINVMPSYREGFGITNIEAAAMGLPVVATQIPGCVDSVQDGVTGTLVPPRDAAALAGAIRRYLEDPLLCRVHGQAGRDRVLQEYRPNTIHEALYQEYLGSLREKGIPAPASESQRNIGTTEQDHQDRCAA